jgi:2-polyprenyl-3-methyl-5-hydroxy-6-metoxy-1,4-benzoquinol methylase
MSETSFTVAEDELIAVFRQKYSRATTLGWGPRMRLKHGYFTPDDYYEALVGKLLPEGADWCDVGCGRNIFPENPDLARQYARRCRFVFGIDPDDNVRENALVNEYFQGFVEDCRIERQFDLITLRMVAEHIANPEAAFSRLAGLLKPGGHAVIYTPHKWAPMSIIANVIPFGLHNPLKRLLWNSEPRDTFPTQYKLNTRKDIDRVAKLTGLEQVHYQRLDDCRITNSYRLLNRLELASRSALHTVGIPYPEACILTVLRLQQHQPATMVN